MSVMSRPAPVAQDTRSRRVLNPTLYEVNTRVLLRRLEQKTSKPATLDDIPESMLDFWVDSGFDWVWLLGVWQTGPTGQRISRSNAAFREEYHHVLPDFTDYDICGSCFPVADYSVSNGLGGNSALQRLRERLSKRNLKLMLDFVPNHTSPDHPWVREHPEYYIRGTEENLSREAWNYCRLGATVFAYGRDPYFAGWPDTVQLNYAELRFQDAMRAELLKIARLCDGVRCDMAMLMLPDVFERTWGRRPEPFWPTAIQAVRRAHPDFLFLAEVYWDREWDLQQQGFDYTYDKRLYDRLRDQHAVAVREHLKADLNFQMRSARFLENHDEPRAAATFPEDVHKAAAAVTFFCPGLRFFHEGQFEGSRLRIPVHLNRGPVEAPNGSLYAFYEQLLKGLEHPEFRTGEWRLLECDRAWDDNWTSQEFICFSWSDGSQPRFVVAVNYSAHQSQCLVKLPFEGLRGRQVRFRDIMGSAVYERSGDDMAARGLYLDMPPWGLHIFNVSR
jgi:glycosidase